MKNLISFIPVLLLAGCAGPRGDAPSTIAATRSIQSANVGAIRAQASARKARVAIRTASDAVTVLERTATPEQASAVVVIKESLTTARLQVEEAETQLIAVSHSLAESDARLTTLQRETDRMAADLVVARKRVSAYHRLKFWLALAGAGFAFYTAMRLIPPLGPYKWWAVGGAGVAAFGILWGIL